MDKGFVLRDFTSKKEEIMKNKGLMNRKGDLMKKEGKMNSEEIRKETHKDSEVKEVKKERKKKNILYYPFLAMSLIATAVFIFVINFIIPVHNSVTKGYLDFKQVEVREHETLVALDESGYIFIMKYDENGSYVDTTKDTGYEYLNLGYDIDQIIAPGDIMPERSQIIDLMLDDNQKLYIHYIVLSDEAYVTEEENIICYDYQSGDVYEVVHYSYSRLLKKPKRKNLISAISVGQNEMTYLFRNNDTTYSKIQTSLDGAELETVLWKKDYGYNTIGIATPSEDGRYAVVMTNGGAGVVDLDGAYTEFYENQYSILDCYENLPPNKAYLVNQNLYCYELIDGYEKLVPITGEDAFVPVINFEELDEFFATATVRDIEFFGKNAYAITDEGVLFFADGEVIGLYDGMYIPPTGFIFRSFTSVLFNIIAGILLLAGAVLLIGAMMGWHFSLLSKQLIMVVPCVAAIVVVLCFVLLESFRDVHSEQVLKQMIAVNEVAAKLIDGDRIAQITDMEAVDNGSIYRYHRILADILDQNQGYWNKKYDFIIYAFVSYDGEETLTDIASSFDYNIPYNSLITFEEEGGKVMENIEGDSHSESYNLTASDGKQFYVVDTGIYDSNGNLVGTLELSADIDTIDEMLDSLYFRIFVCLIIFIPLLIGVIALITFINVRNLYRVQKAVGEIASGDFTARVSKPPKDEVGQIGKSVNQMAEQLDAYFQTMEKNEKFYYKFVPEKFRELLHKDELTDLALGDAESAELTVLFCDIRAFSLNSEMMTAKENFDFVNIVYGKAGPIIRKHNGFIDKYIGDAIMALFENADDAVQAGIELYREVVLNPATAEQLGVSSINIGIGIHSGMARIGIVGEEERMSGTVISNTVNLSSRLESLTKRYGAAMIISKDTLDRLSNPDDLNTRYLGMVQVAGVNEVKSLYEVLDCFSEKDRQFRDAVKDDFREAIRLYHLGDLHSALQLFKSIKAKNAAQGVEDRAVELYTEYIEEQLKQDTVDFKIFRFSRK